MLLITLKLMIFGLTANAFDHLEVLEIRDSNRSYESFCLREPGECVLVEDAKTSFSDDLYSLLHHVNTEVNLNTKFILDLDQYSEEERWSLPTELGGDCEDNALLKRKILVEKYGIARSSIRMVTAFHKDMFYAHALLAVLTDQGAYILDQDEDVVYNAKDANYIFESMELPGRKWKRFVQEW